LVAEKITAEERLSYAFVFSSVIIIVTLAIFSLHQESSECSQVDPYKELKNAGESACFTGKNEKSIRIKYITHGKNKVLLYIDYIKFQFCINGECKLVTLVDSEKMYIGRVIVIIDGIYRSIRVKNLYVSTDGKELKFSSN
jgi:hypothetical protein